MLRSDRTVERPYDAPSYYNRNTGEALVLLSNIEKTGKSKRAKKNATGLQCSLLIQSDPRMEASNVHLAV